MSLDSLDSRWATLRPPPSLLFHLQVTSLYNKKATVSQPCLLCAPQRGEGLPSEASSYRIKKTL